VGLGELARKLSRNKVVRFLLAGAGVVTLDNLDIVIPTKFEVSSRNPVSISSNAYASESENIREMVFPFEKDGRRYSTTLRHWIDKGKHAYQIEIEVKTPNTEFSHIDSLALLYVCNTNLYIDKISYNTSNSNEWQPVPKEFSKSLPMSNEGIDWVVFGVRTEEEAIAKIKELSEKFDPVKYHASYKLFQKEKKTFAIPISGISPNVDGIRIETTVDYDEIYGDLTYLLTPLNFSRPKSGTLIPPIYCCLIMMNKDKIEMLRDGYKGVVIKDNEKIPDITVFAIEKDENVDIYRKDPDGSEHRLTHHKAIDCNPVLSPDRRYITFYSNRDGKGDMYILCSDGKCAIRRLTSGGAYLYGTPTAWSPNGEWIAFSWPNNYGVHQIEIIRPNGEDRTRLTNSNRMLFVDSWVSNTEIKVDVGGKNTYQTISITDRPKIGVH